MAEHIINFVEGDGISIQASLDVHQEAWQVEIADILAGLLEAKGDLVTAADADTPARLPAGTDGQVLTADSTTDTGLAWAAAGSGAGSLVWIPLFDSPDGTAVLDTDHNVVVTHVPIA
jgi:hypothetical protein